MFVGTQNTWDKYLPQLAGAIRSSVNKETGFTANKLMLGRETCHPADLMFPGGESRAPEQSTDEYVKDLEAAITSAHRIARENLKTSQKRMKKSYDVKILEKSYQVGDPVYILDKASVKGKSKKLCPPWKDPGIIVEKLSSAIHRVKTKTGHPR